MWENLCNTIVPQFVGRTPRGEEGMTVNRITSLLPLLAAFWLHLYVFSYRGSFLVGIGLFQQWLLRRLL